MEVRAITLGPRSREIGRAYGLRTSADGYSQDERAMFQSIAEALSGWSLQRGVASRPPFVLFMEMPGGKRWLLLRGGYLGEGFNGSVAVAHGLLFDLHQLNALGNQPELLLPLIPPPEADTQSETVRFDPDKLTPVSAIPGLDGQALRDKARCWIAVKGELTDERLQKVLRGVEYSTNSTPIEWCTDASLPAVYKFDPSRFALVVSAHRSVPDGTKYDYVIGAEDTIVGGLLAPRNAWSVLFRPTPAEQERVRARAAALKIELPQLSSDVAKALEGVRWMGNYSRFPRASQIGATIQQIEGTVHSRTALFDLLQTLALRAAIISEDAEATRLERQAASDGLALYFQNFDSRGAEFGKNLDAWMQQVQPVLEREVGENLRMALDRDSLHYVSSRSIRALLQKASPKKELLNQLNDWFRDGEFELTSSAREEVFILMLDWLFELKLARTPLAATVYRTAVDRAMSDPKSRPPPVNLATHLKTQLKSIFDAVISEKNIVQIWRHDWVRLRLIQLGDEGRRKTTRPHNLRDERRLLADREARPFVRTPLPRSLGNALVLGASAGLKVKDARLTGVPGNG